MTGDAYRTHHQAIHPESVSWEIEDHLWVYLKKIPILLVLSFICIAQLEGGAADGPCFLQLRWF